MSSQKATVARYTDGVRRGDLGSPNPELHLDRVIEEGDTVAVVGHGGVALGAGDRVDFVYSEVFTFRAALMSRLDTFHVWLGEVSAA